MSTAREKRLESYASAREWLAMHTKGRRKHPPNDPEVRRIVEEAAREPRKYVEVVGQRNTARECLAKLVRAQGNEESAYWIGLLIADGSVSDGTVHLGLSEEKSDHLERFARFIGATSVSYNPGGQIVRWKSGHVSVARPSWHVSKHSKKISAVLESYGVAERKARVRGLENNRHFWRGVVDGDGWICTVTCKRKHGRIETRWASGICGGSKALMVQFAEFVRTVCPEWRGDVVHPSVWGVYLVGRIAAKIVRELYGNCATALPRKMRVARAILDGKPPMPGMTSAFHDYTPPHSLAD